MDKKNMDKTKKAEADKRGRLPAGRAGKRGETPDAGHDEQPGGALRARRAKKASMNKLVYAVVLFQLTGLLLVSVKTLPVSVPTLVTAGVFPLVSALVMVLLPRVWPVDRLLLALTVFLCGVGMVIIQDITKPITSFMHAMYYAAGLGGMIFVIGFTRALRRWETFSPIAMGLSMLLLMLPLLFGRWVGGAKNWIRIPLGGFSLSLQPSEFVKVLLLFVLAACFSQRQRRVMQLVALGFSAACCGVLLLSSDLGALLIFFSVTLLLFYAATSNLPLTLAGLGAAAGGSVIAYKMFSHVRVRVEVWQNPWADPMDKGYQVVQALIAIGSGGAFGMGLGLGLPRIIPLYNSDFVFAAVTEEFGTIFAVGLLCVYLLMAARGIYIAMNARTAFHALLAAGAAIMLGIQAFIIVGGVIKMIPLTGVTLPFISTGGSSQVSCMALSGVMLAVSSINAQQQSADYALAGAKGQKGRT